MGTKSRRYERGYRLPAHYKVDRLLDGNFDPQTRPFEVRMTRLEARNLRREFFGSKGLNDVPQGEGLMQFDLPQGWMMLLDFDEASTSFDEAGIVVGHFTPSRQSDAV